MNFTRKHNPAYKLNLTPMIDVVFLLIIFFMLISRFSSQERTLIDLPTARDADTKNIATEQQKVIINIMANGEILIGQAVYTDQTLATLLDGHQNDKVLIRSDKSCSWDMLQPVLKACRQAGITNPEIAVLKQ